MNTRGDIKALFIICNAGFASDIMDIARGAGAKGATILNARGTSGRHQSIMGITIDTEKEIILILIEQEIADRIMTSIHEQVGIKTPAHTLCYTMPVERTTPINNFDTEPTEEDSK